jgi:TrmH family RNA methyltransferase
MFASTAVPASSSRVSSRQHPIVRAFRDARDAAAGPAIVLDGAHLIREALAAGVPVQTLLASSHFLSDAPREDRDVIKAAARAGADVHEATAAVMDAASPVRTSSGVVALARWLPAPLATVLGPAGRPALVLGLLNVQDPGNVGAVIRSADALGATGVVALDRTAHPGGWKALRGAMGSTFRVPVGRDQLLTALTAARAAGLRVVATVPHGAAPLDHFDLAQPTLVVLGNEGAGLPAELDEHIGDAAERVSIPMREGVDSLNVAVSAALVLYEAMRQRR